MVTSSLIIYNKAAASMSKSTMVRKSVKHTSQQLMDCTRVHLHCPDLILLPMMTSEDGDVDGMRQGS